MSENCPRCGTSYHGSRLGICPRCLLGETALIPPALGGSVEILEEIGTGGMGTVHLGRHVRLDQTVAVKLLAPHLCADPEFEKRFEREARALAMLSHPNIVGVHDFGREDDQSYIVMEYVGGGSIASRIPLEVPEAIEIAIQTLDALAYAHKKGVVHRDIKPANILLDADGRVKVSDFGIARLVGPDSQGWTVTSAHEVAGTPFYMAPEAKGGAEPDPRMDIYSVGVFLYQMVTGRLPLGDFDAAPSPLDPIIRKALAPDPKKRYSSAEEMKRALLEAGHAALRPPRPQPSTPAGTDQREWLYEVALVATIATALVLWVLTYSILPKQIQLSDVHPLTTPTYVVRDGRYYSLARFETGPTLGALGAIVFGIAAIRMLGRHWRRAGLSEATPDQPIREASWVLAGGVLVILMFAFFKLLEFQGHAWIRSYKTIPAGVLEVMVLFLFWVSVLEAWRTRRALWREPRIFAGMGLALIPPSYALYEEILPWLNR